MLRYLNPELVTMGRHGSGLNDSGHFRYDGKMYRLTGRFGGRFGGGAAEIRDNEGNLSWLKYTDPVYVEYKKQADEFSWRQASKAAKKRAEMMEQKKKAAALSTSAKAKVIVLM